MTNKFIYLSLTSQDPGIGIEDQVTSKTDGGYHALAEGLKRDVFIKTSNGSNLVGKVCWHVAHVIHLPRYHPAA